MKNFILKYHILIFAFTTATFGNLTPFKGPKLLAFTDGPLVTRSLLDTRQLRCPPGNGVCPNNRCCPLSATCISKGCCLSGTAECSGGGGCCSTTSQCVPGGCCPSGHGRCPNS